MKTRKKLQRPQRCFLGDLLGIVIVARQPAREIIRRIQMRHDHSLEARDVGFDWQRSFFPKGTRGAAQTTYCPRRYGIPGKKAGKGWWERAALDTHLSDFSYTRFIILATDSPSAASEDMLSPEVQVHWG
jgi:hypothetical protein